MARQGQGDVYKRQGSGNRMGQDIPKQFMHVDNCPIIIHTMMAFQKHPDIQGIAVDAR